MVPPGTAYPYVVSNVASDVADHAFQKDVSQLTMRFSLFHGMEQSGSLDPLQRCSDILGRIYGNWSSASPATAPTRGFHRHPLVIASGSWAGTFYMMWDNSREEHEAGVYHFVEEYKLFPSK